MLNSYNGNRVFLKCVEELSYIPGEIEFSNSSMIFYSPLVPKRKKKVEIKYSSIVWIEKKNYLGVVCNRMILYTKEQREYLFISIERDKIVDFLMSKASLADKKPMNSKERLRNTAGEKIRRQYFNVYKYILISYIPMMLFIACMVTNGRKIPSVNIIEVIEVIAVFLLPVFILSFMNRFLFGKIICVLDKNGINCANGFIPWEAVERIEYQIELPRKGAARNYCFARIIGKDVNIKVPQSPCYLMWRARKYNEKIKVKFSKDSIITIVFFAVMPTVVGILFLSISNF